MSSDKIAFSAKKREVKGKKVQALREAGIIPANMYEKGKDSTAIQLPFLEMVKVWKEAGKHTPVEIDLDGEKHLAMIKTVTYDPVKAVLTHVSFHAINKNETVEAEIPVRIEGDAPAERQGNFVIYPTKSVLVKSLPLSLPDVLTANAETLIEPGDTLKVSDLKLPEGVQFITDVDLSIAVVEEPRAEEEPEETEEEIDPADVPTDHGGGEGDEDGSDSSESSGSEGKSE